MKTLQFIAFLLVASVATAQEPLTLERAIGAARAQRPAFEAARLRVVEARHSRRAFASFPTTRLLVGYTSDPEAGGSDDDLVLSQPLDVFGRTAAARAIGDAQVARAEAAFRQVAAEVQNEVVNAYVEAAASAELAKTAASVQETLQRLYEATRLRVEGGVAPGVQLTRVGLELEQAKLKTERRHAELEANLRRLASVLGSDVRPPALAGIPTLPIASVDEAALVRQRADLLLLATELGAARAEARVATLAGLPELEIQARRTPWQQADDRFGLRVQLSVPLFDHGRARAETRAAGTRSEAARKALADATSLAKGEAAAARIEVESALEQVGRYTTLVTTARQLVERLQPALTEQATTLIEVIDATRSLRDIEEALVEARQRLAAAQARFLRATGHLLEVSK